MRSRREPTLPISAQAARWLVTLMDADATDTAAFVAWLKQSPRHVEEFLFATATWRQLRELGARAPVDLDALLAEARASAESNVIALPTPASSSSQRLLVADDDTRSQEAHRDRPSANRASTLSSRARWAAGIAAIALPALLTWFAWGLGSTYSTDIGEQRTVRLEDGSVVYLNTDTRARVRFSGNHRDIELLEGEALFVVAHESSRPFRVRTRNAVAEAVGTQFNVRRYGGDTRVSVVEGRVKVAPTTAALTKPPESRPAGSTGTNPLQTEPTLPQMSSDGAALLAAGEGATIASNGHVVKNEDVDMAQAVAWRQRRLVFRADRLEDVLTELNRYSTRRFRIEGTLARETRLTATFDVDKPESLAAFLERYSNLTVERQGDELVIRDR